LIIHGQEPLPNGKSVKEGYHFWTTPRRALKFPNTYFPKERETTRKKRKKKKSSSRGGKRQLQIGKDKDIFNTPEKRGNYQKAEFKERIR